MVDGNTDNAKPRISIVVPLFNEEGGIAQFHAALSSVLVTLPRYDFTIVFVNDGSRDNSLLALRELCREHANVRVVDLSRNFGKEIALTAGVHYAAASDAIICMDADLQHPPTKIPEIIALWEAGADTVVGVRKETENNSWVREVGSNLFYSIMRRISEIDLENKTTDFRLINRKVIEAFCMATERKRLFRGIVDWLGFRKVCFEFVAPQRYDGKPRYSLGKLLSLAIHSITAFSLWPLRLTGYLGVTIFGLSSLLFLVMVVVNLIRWQWYFSALALMAVSNIFLISIVLMALGMVAIYVGIIHTEVINRPLYIVNDIHGEKK